MKLGGQDAKLASLLRPPAGEREGRRRRSPARPRGALGLTGGGRGERGGIGDPYPLP